MPIKTFKVAKFLQKDDTVLLKKFDRWNWKHWRADKAEGFRCPWCNDGCSKCLETGVYQGDKWKE